MSYVSNSVIICPTARLARALQLMHQQAQRASGLQQWQPLNIRTLDTWLDELLSPAILTGEIDVDHAPQKRLSQIQERLIWQEVILSTLKNHSVVESDIGSELAELFDIAGLANAAIEANRYVVAWNLHIPAEVESIETQQFLLWQKAFYSRCKSLYALESVRYFSWQIDCIKRGAGNLPEEVLFAGFDQAAPQELALRAALVARGCVVGEYQTALAEPSSAKHLKLATQEDEYRAMVAWAKMQLELQPENRLALVVPNLSELRNRLVDLLDDVFQPETVRASHAEVPRIYNFSLGSALTQQAIIQTALHLIRLFSSRKVTQADISCALLSTYFSASVSEADARAQLDANMRELLPQKMQWPKFIRFMNQQLADLKVDKLQQQVIDAVNWMQSQPRMQKPSHWVEVFKRLLTMLEWGGERIESSHEYQAKQAWDKALLQLAQLDLLGESYQAGMAASLLNQICNEQVFQPETTGEPAIQILGMMEALSTPVDVLWVMGMNDHLWPPPARPNPLLPAYIQRAAKVSNADSTVQAEFALQIHQRLMRSGHQVIFSSSLKDGDRELRASPLMQGIPVEDTSIGGVQAPNLAKTIAEQVASRGNAGIRLIDDHVAPPVKEGEHIRGGTGLLKAQAICPAWAFYQYRLGAKALKVPQNGLDASQRGQLVHCALEKFWSAFGAEKLSTELLVMSDASLAKHIADAASAGIQEFTQKADLQLSPHVLELENERLQKLLAGWLALEKSRELPFTVLACEEKKTFQIQGVEVTVVIDRIDALADGSQVLIDYKTGRKPDIKNWADSRITEPQLPVYAAFSLAQDSQVAAVCFGMVKTAEHAFSGLSEAAVLPGIKPFEEAKNFPIELFSDWQALQTHWKQSLEAIALEIKAGEASVKFENEKDLEYCEVAPLLRLPERQLQYERQLEAGLSHE